MPQLPHKLPQWRCRQRQSRPQPKPAVADFACSHTPARSHSFPFGSFHLRIIHENWYYSCSDPGGMDGWVSPVGWPIADSLPAVTCQPHIWRW